MGKGYSFDITNGNFKIQVWDPSDGRVVSGGTAKKESHARAAVKQLRSELNIA